MTTEPSTAALVRTRFAGFFFLIAGSIAVACMGAASSPQTTLSSAAPSGGASSPSVQGSADGVASVSAVLQAAGASVVELGEFDTEPLGGRGASLCVDGQQVSLYLFPTSEERAAATSRINPTDPSDLGTAMVSWAGNPKFWQSGRVVALYLGSDPAVEAGLTSVFGQPFARGQGRDPGPGGHDC